MIGLEAINNFKSDLEKKKVILKQSIESKQNQLIDITALSREDLDALMVNQKKMDEHVDLQRQIKEHEDDLVIVDLLLNEIKNATDHVAKNIHYKLVGILNVSKINLDFHEKQKNDTLITQSKKTLNFLTNMKDRFENLFFPKN